MYILWCCTISIFSVKWIIFILYIWCTVVCVMWFLFFSPFGVCCESLLIFWDGHLWENMLTNKCLFYLWVNDQSASLQQCLDHDFCFVFWIFWCWNDSLSFFIFLCFFHRKKLKIQKEWPESLSLVPSPYLSVCAYFESLLFSILYFGLILHYMTYFRSLLQSSTCDMCSLFQDCV